MSKRKFNTVDACIELATFAHNGQVDKAGMPYIDHPLRVLWTIQEGGYDTYTQMTAILHDVTEDTSFNSSVLLQLGVPMVVVYAVDLLDRYESMNSYKLNSASVEDTEVYLTADHYYYKKIRGNPMSLAVKVADIKDNLDPNRLSGLPLETRNRLTKKYGKALEVLLG